MWHHAFWMRMVVINFNLLFAFFFFFFTNDFENLIFFEWHLFDVSLQLSFSVRTVQRRAKLLLVTLKCSAISPLVLTHSLSFSLPFTSRTFIRLLFSTFFRMTLIRNVCITSFLPKCRSRCGRVCQKLKYS